MTALIRSWLYAPGHHPERVRKALGSGADAVIIDLEDSVPAARKDDARRAALEILATLPDLRPAVWVRINPLGTSTARADLEALAETAVDGIRIPRAEDPEAVRAAAHAMARPVHLLLETAIGLLAARELAAADPLVEGIALGEADLAADLRCGSEGLEWARGSIVAISRGHGLDSPVQSVHTSVTDLDGLTATTRLGRGLGFFGRTLIHPRQIDPVHAVYQPGADELARAQEIVATAAQAKARGEAAALTPDGRFVDPAVVAGARLVIDLANLSSLTPSVAAPGETHEH